MTVQEDERAIFETEPHRDCTLIASLVRNAGLHGGRSHVENTNLHLRLGDQEAIKSMLVVLSDQSVLRPAGMRVQNRHYVILHEGESIAEVGPPGAFIWHGMLDSDDNYVGAILSVVGNVGEQPLFQVDLGVGFDAAHIPRADGKLDMVNRGKLLRHRLQLLIDVLALLTAVARVQMLALYDVNAGLHGVLVERVDDEAADDFRFVIQLAKEAFFAVASDPRYGRVCSRVLSTQIVAHVGPHRAEILNDRVAILLVHKGNSICVDSWPARLLQIEA